MKPITKPIAILAHAKPEYSAVIHRLKSMGFKHACDFSHERIMSDWGGYPVFDISRPASGVFSRNSESAHFPNVVPAAQFLAEYGVGETAASETPAQPETPLNPPNFVVDTDRNETLSRIVQELALAAELPWAGGSLDVKHDNFRYIHVTRSPDGDIFDKAGLMLDTTSIADCAKDRPVYSAATQMGEIVRLLSTPVEPPVPPAPTPPTLYGYNAVYKAGAPTINFGCAEISVNLLECIHAVMDKPQPGNRILTVITLSSGKTLDRDGIGMALAYVAAVDERAKKYPSTPASK